MKLIQEKLFKFKQTRLCESSYKLIKIPINLKKYNQFLLDNTRIELTYFMIKNKETNLKYLYQMMTAKDNHPVSLLTLFEDLDDIVQDFD